MTQQQFIELKKIDSDAVNKTKSFMAFPCKAYAHLAEKFDTSKLQKMITDIRIAGLSSFIDFVPYQIILPANIDPDESKRIALEISRHAQLLVLRDEISGLTAHFNGNNLDYNKTNNAIKDDWELIIRRAINAQIYGDLISGKRPVTTYEVATRFIPALIEELGCGISFIDYKEPCLSVRSPLLDLTFEFIIPKGKDPHDITLATDIFINGEQHKLNADTLRLIKRQIIEAAGDLTNTEQFKTFEERVHTVQEFSGRGLNIFLKNALK